MLAGYAASTARALKVRQGTARTFNARTLYLDLPRRFMFGDLLEHLTIMRVWRDRFRDYLAGFDKYGN